MQSNLQTMKEADKSIIERPPHIKEGSVGWMLNRVTRIVDDIMKKQLEPLGLTQLQFAIMMTLFEQDGVSQATIGKQIIMPGYAMTRNLDALAQLGFVERRPDENSRRSFRIVLTEDGRALAPKLFSIVARVNGDFLSELQEDEVSQLKVLLRKLSHQKLILF